MITHYLCSKCGELRGASILECPCQPRQLHDPRIFGAAKVGCEAVHQREDKLKPMGAVVFDGWLNKYPGHLPTLYDGADRAKSMLGMTGKTLRVRVYEVTEETP